MPLKCTIAYNCFGGYCVPLSSQHRPAAQTILRGEVYEPNTIGFMAAYCGEGDIVHAGTYFGDFLPALSRCCKGEIWAFEPNSENFRCAQITLTLNDITNVRLIRAGLGATAGHLPLLTSDANGVARGGASMIIADQASAPGDCELVPIVTIDDAVAAASRISIIQLDVEGQEQQALAGAFKTIDRDHPVIIVEILADSPLRSTDWLAKNILARGYRMTGSIHGNAVFLPPQSSPDLKSQMPAPSF